jgi:hypothetical protein
MSSTPMVFIQRFRRKVQNKDGSILYGNKSFVPIDKWGWELSMLHVIVLQQNLYLPE